MKTLKNAVAFLVWVARGQKAPAVLGATAARRRREEHCGGALLLASTATATATVIKGHLVKFVDPPSREKDGYRKDGRRLNVAMQGYAQVGRARVVEEARDAPARVCRVNVGAEHCGAPFQEKVLTVREDELGLVAGTLPSPRLRLARVDGLAGIAGDLQSRVDPMLLQANHTPSSAW